MRVGVRVDERAADDLARELADTFEGLAAQDFGDEDVKILRIALERWITRTRSAVDFGKLS